MKSLILFIFGFRQVQGIKISWLPDQGIEKVGAIGLDPYAESAQPLSDVNRAFYQSVPAGQPVVAKNPIRQVATIG